MLDSQFTYILNTEKHNGNASLVKKIFLSTEIRVRSQVSPYEICGGQSGAGSGFNPKTLVSPCHYQSCIAPYSSSSARCFSQSDKRTKLFNLRKQCFSEIRENYTEKYFYKHQRSELSHTAGAVFSYLGTQIRRTLPKHNPRQSSQTSLTELICTQENISNKPQ